MAVADMGLSPSEFWELSWYEWGLYMLRLEKKQQKDKLREEMNWDRTRIMWATLINVNAKTKVKPRDLIELSFDKKESEVPKPGSVIERFKEKTSGSKRIK